MTNIYFIIDKKSKAVKIGRSDSPEERKAQLQVGSSNLLEVMYVIENLPKSMEYHIQDICKRYHIRGEWFRKEVIEDHLLKMPYYRENMKKIKR